MRVEPYQLGSVVHVVKRGARGANIVFEASDMWRFARALYLLNDEYKNNDWTRRTDAKVFGRPSHWPPRDTLVSVLAWTLLDNHFHLVLQIKKEHGMSKFMQRLCGSMTTYANEKYRLTGSLFQGSYKSRTVESDDYLQHLMLYVLVKNVFEMHPQGFNYAVENFSEAWQWASEYPFSSFNSLVYGKSSPVIDMGACKKLGLCQQEYFKVAENMVKAHSDKRLLPPELQLEPW